MIIKSKYKKFLLTLVGKYKILPATKSSIKILLNFFPCLESEKKFESAYRHLREAKLLRKISLFDNEGNTRDAIEITQKGINTLKENGIDVEKMRKSIYAKNSNIKTKQLLYKTAETDIFFRGASKENSNLKFLDRDSLIDVPKKNRTWENAEQYKGARINGLLYTGYNFLPVYNVKNSNIKINPNTETGFINGVLTSFGYVANKDEKIILADSIEIIDKTILSKEFKIENSDKKKNSIFQKSTYSKDVKIFLFLNNIEQQKLVKLLHFQDFDVLIKSYIEIEFGIENNEKRIDFNNILFGDLSIYESETEVGFCIIRQELNYINRLYRLLNSVRDKIEKGKRKLVVYGLPCNKALYNKVFERFPYTEFREINEEDFWRFSVSAENDKCA